MPRTYKPVPGVSRLQYTPESVTAALKSISEGMPISKASKIFNIPYTTLQNRLSGRSKVYGKAGRKTALLPHEEEIIAQHIVTLADFGYAFDVPKLCEFVRSYIRKSGRVVPQFKDDLPGKDWAAGYLERHKVLLSQRICQNIPRKRAAVSEVEVKKFFENLKISLEDVPPENVINFDETNLTDDPKGKLMIYRRGVKHAERVMNSSKSSISIMFACSAGGKLLPPYVVYKAEHLMDTWTYGGPVGTRYNRTKSGWFDQICFEDWFLKCVIPFVRKMPQCEKKLIIGDNLTSHFSALVLEMCEAYNIRFVFLPPNSTGILQPLDVGVYGPMKRAWKRILTNWKMTSQGAHTTAMPKQHFPSLLCQLLEEMDNLPELAVSAFKACGIVPFVPERVLSKLRRDLPDADTSREYVSDLVLQEIRSLRESAATPPGGKKRRGKRVKVEPGASVTAADVSLPSTSRTSPTSGRPYTGTSNPKCAKRQPRRLCAATDSSESDTENELPVALQLQSPKELMDPDLLEVTPVITEMTLNIGDYVLVKFKSRTGKQKDYHYVGKLLKRVDATQWSISYLRKVESAASTSAQSGKQKHVFKEPAILDIHITPTNDIVMLLEKPDIHKNKLCFDATFHNMYIR